MTQIVRQGVWWLPSVPDLHVSGTLVFDDDKGLTLNLLGALDETPLGGPWPSYPILQGCADGGEAITLTNCSLIGRHQAYPGFLTQRYRPAHALIGCYFDAPDELQFYQVRFWCSHLEEWFGSRPFYVRPEVAESDGRWRQEFGFERISALRCGLDDVNFSAGQDFDVQEGVLELHIDYRTSASFGRDTPLTIAQWEERYLQPFRNLLALASGAHTRVLHTEFRVEPGLRAGTMPRVNSVELITPSLCYLGEKPELLGSDRMLFVLDDVRDQFPVVLANWLKLSRELSHVINLYLGARNNRALCLEQQFLNTIQALEGYQRHRFPPKSRREAKRPLKDRLADLIGYISTIMIPWIASDCDENTFAKRAADFRNDLSHALLTPGHEALNSEALWWMMEGLSWLLEACLLRSLGLTYEHVTALVQRNQRYQNTVRHAPNS
jgi:hypothetical protein